MTREEEFTRRIKPLEVVDDSVELDRSVMKKDNSVKFGSTKCDLCQSPATTTRGSRVVCSLHAISNMNKVATDEVSLKDAPQQLADQHKQK